MTRPRDLIVGNCYFLLNYFGSGLIVPSIQTLIYAGTYQDTQGGSEWLFREPGWSPEDGDDASPADNSPLVAFHADSLYQVLELKGLIRELGGLIDFHPLTSPRTDAPVATPRTDCPELDAVIQRFLTSPVGTTVTITIEFTDDGFSLRKEAAGVAFVHFLSAKTETVQEALVRRISSEYGCTPIEDYLSNRGRTRILCYRVADDAATITTIGSRILCEVYAMRGDDSLKPKFRSVTAASR